MVIANLVGAFEGPELLIILALVLLLFGGKKLPQLARSLGQAKKEFHDGAASSTDTSATETSDTAALPAAGAAEDEEMVAVPQSELDRLRKAAHEPTE